MIINNEVYEVIKKHFVSLKNRYQNNLEYMKNSEFVFDFLHLLHCKCHKINLNRGGLHIDAPDWIETKKQQKIISIKKIINAFNTQQQPH